MHADTELATQPGPLPAGDDLRVFEHLFYCREMLANDGTGQRGHVMPKHVWVNVTSNPANRAPGVLLDWRQVDGVRWEAFVLWAEGGGNVRGRAHLEWVRAEHVKPLQGQASQ